MAVAVELGIDGKDGDLDLPAQVDVGKETRRVDLDEAFGVAEPVALAGAAEPEDNRLRVAPRRAGRVDSRAARAPVGGS